MLDATFKIGQTYFMTFSGDADLLPTLTIVKRTTKFVTFTIRGVSTKRKIEIIDGVETIRPDGKFSGAPICRATNVVSSPATRDRDHEEKDDNHSFYDAGDCIFLKHGSIYRYLIISYFLKNYSWADSAFKAGEGRIYNSENIHGYFYADLMKLTWLKLFMKNTDLSGGYLDALERWTESDTDPEPTRDRLKEDSPNYDPDDFTFDCFFREYSGIDNAFRAGKNRGYFFEKDKDIASDFAWARLNLIKLYLNYENALGNYLDARESWIDTSIEPLLDELDGIAPTRDRDENIDLFVFLSAFESGENRYDFLRKYMHSDICNFLTCARCFNPSGFLTFLAGVSATPDDPANLDNPLDFLFENRCECANASDCNENDASEYRCMYEHLTKKVDIKPTLERDRITDAGFYLTISDEDLISGEYSISDLDDAFCYSPGKSRKQHLIGLYMYHGENLCWSERYRILLPKRVGNFGPDEARNAESWTDNNFTVVFRYAFDFTETEKDRLAEKIEIFEKAIDSFSLIIPYSEFKRVLARFL